MRPFKVKSSHYPSGARIHKSDGTVIGSCIRSQYYSWKGEQEQEEIDTSGLWKMDIGNAIHEWVADKANKVYKVTEEYPVVYHPEFMEYPIRGRIDSLVTDSPHGNFGIEIKSAYGRGITNKETGVKYVGPKMSHLMQAFIYLCISKLPQEDKEKYMPVDDVRSFVLPELDFFMLFYIARDNAYRKQFFIKLMHGDAIIEKVGASLSEEKREALAGRDNILTVTDGTQLFIYEYISFREIVRSYMAVERYVSSNTVPPRDFTFEYNTDSNGNLIAKPGTGWECSYCRFNRICWLRDIETEE